MLWAISPPLKKSTSEKETAVPSNVDEACLLRWRPMGAAGLRSLLSVALLVVTTPGCVAYQLAGLGRQRSRRCPAAEMAQLTLVRHGQSEWNLANRFTGWVDVDLTERGITEARRAGAMLLENGLQHDLVVTSRLRRAIRTACLVLSGTDQCWVPMLKDVRLNEQHSGMLTGNNKRELAEEYGVEQVVAWRHTHNQLLTLTLTLALTLTQVMAWRRTHNTPPPPVEADNPFQQAIQSDERYLDIPVPTTESLQQTGQRVADIWQSTIAPALRSGQNVMVVSHGNTLRGALTAHDPQTSRLCSALALPIAPPRGGACIRAEGACICACIRACIDTRHGSARQARRRRQRQRFVPAGHSDGVPGGVRLG